MFEVHRFRFMWWILLMSWLGIFSLGGCAARSDPTAPDIRLMVQEGTGRLEHRGASPGRVWVFDVEESRMLWSGQVTARSRVMVIPSLNAVVVNDQQVQSLGVRPEATHRIFFEPRS